MKIKALCYRMKDNEKIKEWVKATNKVAKNVFDASKDMQSKMPAAPSMRSLQGDWRVSGLMLVSRVFVGSLCLKY